MEGWSDTANRRVHKKRHVRTLRRETRRINETVIGEAKQSNREYNRFMSYIRREVTS